MLLERERARASSPMKKSRSAMTPALCCAIQFPLVVLALVWPAKVSLTATTVGVMKQGSTFPANPIFVYLRARATHSHHPHQIRRGARSPRADLEREREREREAYPVPLSMTTAGREAASMASRVVPPHRGGAVGQSASQSPAAARLPPSALTTTGRGRNAGKRRRERVGVAVGIPHPPPLASAAAQQQQQQQQPPPRAPEEAGTDRGMEACRRSEVSGRRGAAGGEGSERGAWLLLFSGYRGICLGVRGGFRVWRRRRRLSHAHARTQAAAAGSRRRLGGRWCWCCSSSGWCGGVGLWGWGACGMIATPPPTPPCPLCGLRHGCGRH